MAPMSLRVKAKVLAGRTLAPAISQTLFISYHSPYPRPRHSGLLPASDSPLVLAFLLLPFQNALPADIHGAHLSHPHHCQNSLKY